MILIAASKDAILEKPKTLVIFLGKDLENNLFMSSVNLISIWVGGRGWWKLDWKNVEIEAAQKPRKFSAFKNVGMYVFLENQKPFHA